jgi:TatD DNase family protein
MYDTHCHLTFDDFSDRVEQVLADARAAGVGGCITVSTTPSNAQQGLELASCHEGLWCTSGVHPLYAQVAPDLQTVRAVAEHEACVAWGELGLDHHYDNPPRDLQRDVLEAQLAMIESAVSDGLVLPIVVHCRKSTDDLLAIFRRTTLDPQDFVFHCFTGTVDDARRILDFGAWISFTGVVTFANAGEVAEAAKLVPADRIMVETDAPFLTPEPHRKVRPNEPKFVVHVANRLAELRGIAPEEWERQLDANAERFFRIRES